MQRAAVVRLPGTGQRAGRTAAPAVHALSPREAVASLAAPPAAASPAPTATLLVATDPDLTAGPGESLLLGAPPVPPAARATAPTATPVVVERVAWVQEAAAWGAPLLVGGALLLALTGPSWMRRFRRRREG